MHAYIYPVTQGRYKVRDFVAMLQPYALLLLNVVFVYKVKQFVCSLPEWYGHSKMVIIIDTE